MKNRLKVTTPSEREIAMTREFDAPRRLVFEALTRPELLRRWFGVFGGWSLVVCEIDLRVGGAYRYVWRGPDGPGVGMHGVYREVVPPERLVATERDALRELTSPAVTRRLATQPRRKIPLQESP